MKTLSTFFSLVFAFCLSAITTTKAQVNVNDSLALVDLYNSTAGHSWYYNDGWLTGPVKLVWDIFNQRWQKGYCNLFSR
jgi:hypothetical protein